VAAGEVVNPKPSPSAPEARARVIAFHLPQFHPVPENDEWWGKGFTEWTKTVAARPRFPGHYQPHLPADLGFYDLRLPEARAAQAELARAHGIEGFLFWHYWFGDGRRILQRPVDEIVRSGEPRFPFALAWANESWTGIWHGAADRVLIEQRYPGEADDRAHFEALLPAFTDSRYLTVDSRPILYVFHPEQLPDPAQFVDRWQKMATDAGLPGLFLLAEASNLLGEGIVYTRAAADGFDGSVHLRLPIDASVSARALMRLGRRLHVAELWRYGTTPVSSPMDAGPGRVYPGVYPNWDNTPRCASRGLVLHGSTPGKFRVHLRAAIDEVRTLPSDERLVFVKSWNEWAEGNHLEPDQRFGLGYLEAVRDEVRRGSPAAPGR
jgi:lipopolysaccharide biosynthesis protein